MQKKEEGQLNNIRNQGFDWMLDPESNNKIKEDSFFSYSIKKFISFLYEKLKFLKN